MTFRVAVKTIDDIEWVYNGLVFETELEADGYRIDLVSRWTAVCDAKVEPSTLTANAKWDGRLSFTDHPDIHIEGEDEGYGI